MRPHDPEEEAWAPFDAALRKIDGPEPDPGLRERCLPGSGVRVFGCSGVQDAGGPTPHSALRTPHSRTVLVVDDEPNIRRLIEHHLTAAGYRVVPAADGLEALARVREERPDLIILDVMMPGPDGFRVLQTLKMDPRTVEIPVIMLTALGGDDSVRHGWQEGNDCYLTKPFNPSELVSVVNRMADVLGTPENPPPLRRWLK